MNLIHIGSIFNGSRKFVDQISRWALVYCLDKLLHKIPVGKALE
ncbi:MAG: hypothetical protein V3R69_07860 [candidate division NC10 bacterium]